MSTYEPEMKLATARVALAADALAGVGMGGRGSATLIRWLLLKTKHALPETTVTFDAGDCTDFADRYFGVPGRPGTPHFNPFETGEARWKAGGGSTDWGVQTIYTQLSRLNQAEQRMYSQPVRLPREPRQRQQWQITMRETEAYMSGLQRVMQSRRVPLPELAIWRYRERTDFPADTDVTNLAHDLVLELNLLVAELDTVFSGGDAYVAACVDQP